MNRINYWLIVNIWSDIRRCIWAVARFLFENDLLNIIFLCITLMDISNTHEDSILYHLKCWHAMVFGVFAIIKLCYRLLMPIVRFISAKIRAHLSTHQILRARRFFENLAFELNELFRDLTPPPPDQNRPQPLEIPGIPPFYIEPPQPFMIQGPANPTPSQRIELHRIQVLKRFLVQTVLWEITKEVDVVNVALQNTGHSNFRLGATNVRRFDRLLKNMDFVYQHMPALPTLLKFLKLHDNQRFLVDRLCTLTDGSVMAHFNMPRTRAYVNMPSDSAIVFHAFCLYMDSILLEHPLHHEHSLINREYRPFFENYVLIDLDMHSLTRLSMNPNGCGIYCTDFHEPRFDFVCASNLDQNNAPLCNHNVFTVIIEFLLFVRNRWNNCLCGLDLRPYEVGRLLDI